ncbi:MAG: helix-turn-helix transcriptional regulator [Pleurocapsa sp.]
MYRWGYYCGTGVMNKRELKAAFNALESQAIYQADPELRKIYYTLKKRLRGFEFDGKQDFFYPVRQHINRAINYTDPQEMMSKGHYCHTLFHQIELLETAIIKGQEIELSRHVDLYGNNNLGLITVYPLQLIYYDIAWYLIYEKTSDRFTPRLRGDRTLTNGHPQAPSFQDGERVTIGRINRFQDYLKIVNSEGRSIIEQQKSLNNAHQLLQNGWGLKLGNFDEQQLELQGELDLIQVKVRFFPPVSRFIAEGELRHPRQTIRQQAEYLDYCLELPPRSLDEFSFWVNRYLDKAIILSPPQLIAKHRQWALNLVQKYQ